MKEGDGRGEGQGDSWGSYRVREGVVCQSTDRLASDSPDSSFTCRLFFFFVALPGHNPTHILGEKKIRGIHI